MNPVKLMRSSIFYVFVLCALAYSVGAEQEAEELDPMVTVLLSLASGVKVLQTQVTQLSEQVHASHMRRLGLVIDSDDVDRMQRGWNQVFGPLTKLQMVANDKNPLISASVPIDETFVQQAIDYYKEHKTDDLQIRQQFLPFLSTKVDVAALAAEMRILYDAANKDNCAFIWASALERTGAFGSTAVNDYDKLRYAEDKSWSLTTNAYVRLSEFLMHDPSIAETQQNLFKLASRFVRFFFDDATRFAVFRKVAEKEQFHPLLRLMHSVMWYQLSGSGWRVWSDTVLDGLVADAKQGKEIIYLAGGIDVNQLIISLVSADVKEFRVKVIDPIRATQAKFYGGAEADFMFLVQHPSAASNGIGDQIRLTLQLEDGKNKTVVMRRSSVQSSGEFTVNADQTVTPAFSTQWAVYDLSASNSVPVGVVEFARRLIKQSDLLVDNRQQTLLIGFNELSYLARKEQWGIDIDALPATLELRVKQLAYKIGKPILTNLGALDDVKEFEYIRFGSNTE